MVEQPDQRREHAAHGKSDEQTGPSITHPTVSVSTASLLRSQPGVKAAPSPMNRKIWTGLIMVSPWFRLGPWATGETTAAHMSTTCNVCGGSEIGRASCSE